MAGTTKTLTFSEGVTVSAPSQSFLSASTFQVYVDDAAYVAAKGEAAVDGDCYYNSTLDLVRYYSNGAWSSFTDEDSSQTLTNKTIDADNNTISNLAHGAEVDSPSSGVHGVSGTIVGTSDTQTLTAKKYSGGTASTTDKFVLSRNTNSNLTALGREQGSIYYDTTNDDVLIDDGSALNSIFQDTGKANTNFINNATMQVNQRGLTSSPISASAGSYYIDQWKVGITTFTSNTIQLNTTSQPSALPYPSKSLQLIAGSSTTGDLFLYQLLEDSSYFAGKTVTFSAYVKSDNANTKLRIVHDATTASSSTHAGDDSWQRLSATASITSTLQEVEIGIFSAAASSTDYVEITGVKLEVGSLVTDYIEKSYSTELNMCRRWFLRYDGALATSWTGFTTATDTIGFVVKFPIEFAANPASGFAVSGTITYLNGGTGTATPSLFRGGTESALLRLSAAGLTKDQSTNEVYLSSASYIEFSAEL